MLAATTRTRRASSEVACFPPSVSFAPLWCSISRAGDRAGRRSTSAPQRRERHRDTSISQSPMPNAQLQNAQARASCSPSLARRVSVRNTPINGGLVFTAVRHTLQSARPSVLTYPLTLPSPAGLRYASGSGDLRSVRSVRGRGDFFGARPDYEF